MIDPELKYCPQCHDEYRAEIERCAECKILLITGVEMLEQEKGRQEKVAARKPEIPPDRPPGKVSPSPESPRTWEDAIIEPELKYCPQCHDEYRAEIEQCAACTIPLITGAEVLALENSRQEKLAAGQGEIPADDQLVVIERGPLADLRQLQELLEADGIASRLIGEDRSCSGGCCGPTVLLQVRPEEAADALQVLAAEHQRTTALDQHRNDYGDAIFNPSAPEATCPACGASFSTASLECPDCGLSFK